MILNINPKTETHIFDNSNYYYLDDFAKFQGFKSWQDVEFLECWNIDGLDWDDYKPREKEYCSMIKNIVNKYDTDYINSCVTIKEGLFTM